MELKVKRSALRKMMIPVYVVASYGLAPLGLASFGLASFGLASFASAPASMDNWKSIMSRGDLYQVQHNHASAILSYREAAAFAAQNNLPANCSEMAICREAAVEVQSSLIAQANANCDKLMVLVAREKANKTLDPDLEVWVLNLANAYQANLDPHTREQCLQKLCLINRVLYGENNKEYKNAKALLGKYYEHDQPLRAARIQTTVDQDGALQAEKNSDPMTQGFMLNQLAMHSRMTGDLERAKKADLQLLEMAKIHPQIADGLPTYYASLGTIELAQGNVAGSKSYFARAIKEGSKIRGNKKKEAVVSPSLSALVDSVKTDKDSKFPNLAGDELTQLLAVQRAVSAEPRAQYTLNRLLGEVLQEEHKFEESEKHIERAIEIAKLPRSMVDRDIPGLYMQLATYQAARGQIAKSNELFAKAFAEESNKTGFDATRILVYWGGLANNRSDFTLAEEKLGLAIKQAKALPRAQRGTLLLDALFGSIPAKQKKGELKEVQQIWVEIVAEQSFQRTLNSGFGPNFFHRL
jgi:tetratricopeptide (TPR) repeat protein